MMMSEAFPSKYLSAADLQGRAITLTMGTVEMIDVGSDGNSDHKPVLHFMGAQKGLVLNKTNANCIAEMHGDDTDHWPGKTITIVPAQTDFRGRIVACIRVQPPGVLPATPAPTAPIPGAPLATAPQATATVPPDGGAPVGPIGQSPSSVPATDINDNIPF